MFHIIGPRTNQHDGIQASRNYWRHDRNINGTVYRFVRYEQGDCRYISSRGQHGYKVFRVQLDHETGAERLTPVHQFGTPMPTRGW